jgi:hypothetical protein
MQITPFISVMSRTCGDINKQIEGFAGNLDAKQFVLAGKNLGSISELARKLTDICKLSEDALWYDSQTSAQCSVIKKKDN